MAKTGTAMALIAGECANKMMHGCLGMPIDCMTCTPLEGCLVSAGLRCSYFEKCVLPIANKTPEYAGADVNYWAKLSPQAEGRATDAQKTHPFYRPLEVKPAKAGRCCPDCGRPLAERKRVCELCRLKRRRNTERDNKRRQRR
jgi:hypothetical protein